MRKKGKKGRGGKIQGQGGREGGGGGGGGRRKQR